MIAATKTWIRRFRDDCDGIAATEFAMLAPIMILFYFGMAEICQGFMAQKRTEHVASAVADLVAQADSVSTAELNDVFTVATQIMKPFPSTTLKQRITSVTVNAQGVAKVDWSANKGWTSRTAGSTVSLPSGLLANGESIIMSEVEYAYASPFDYVMPASTTFRKTSYLRPRTTTTVTKTN